MASKLLKHGLIYSVAQLTAALAGLISFPILTKNLTIDEYGAVALFTTLIGLLTSFNKFGIQHSIVRFYTTFSYPDFISNFLSLISVSLVLSSIFILVIGTGLSFVSDLALFKINSLIILICCAFLQSIRSYSQNLFVAMEKSYAVAILESFYRLLSLSTVIVAILLINPIYQNFVYAILSADIILCICIVILLYKKGIFRGFDTTRVEKKHIKTILIFGFPMMGYELSKMIHAFIDRFFIESFLGSRALGLYTVPYNMAMIIGGLLFAGLATAVVPYYLNLWKKEGKQATEKALSQINRYLLLLSPPVIVGLYIICEPLINILTTPEYVHVAYLLPIVAIGVILSNSSILYAAGMQINKDSKTLFQYVLESMVINITLNTLTIPTFGIASAAFNTVISYSWMALRFHLKSRHTISIYFDFWVLTRSCLYCALMYFAAMRINLELPINTLLLRSASGGLVFISLVLIFEKDFRDTSISLIKGLIK
jgi:O-antigen/teichoic acid export membrane protein